jgi:hypothetical protein
MVFKLDSSRMFVSGSSISDSSWYRMFHGMLQFENFSLPNCQLQIAHNFPAIPTLLFDKRYDSALSLLFSSRAIKHFKESDSIIGSFISFRPELEEFERS